MYKHFLIYEKGPFKWRTLFVFDNYSEKHIIPEITWLLLLPFQQSCIRRSFRRNHMLRVR